MTLEQACKEAIEQMLKDNPQMIPFFHDKDGGFNVDTFTYQVMQTEYPWTIADLNETLDYWHNFNKKP